MLSKVFCISTFGIKLSYLSTVTFATYISSFKFSQVVSAQPVPDVSSPREIPLSPEPLPELPNELPVRELPTTPQFVTPEDIPANIVVEKFELVNYSDLLEEVKLKQVFAPYISRPISLVELLEVQRLLTELLVTEGYITTRAVIPPQTIKDLTVKIQIIPGTIEEIQINGLSQLQDNYIRSRITKGTGSPLNHDRLLEVLQLLQLDPLVANVSAELSQGIEPNTSLLNVDITEADTFKPGITLDNSKVASIGTFNREAELRENNFLGFGDRFIVAYSNSDGSDSLSNLSYRVPLSAANNTLTFQHNRATNRVVQEPFDALDIENQTTFYQLAYTHPLLRTVGQEIRFGVDLSRQTTATTFLDGEQFPSIVGATNSDGDTIISTLGLFQDYLKRDRASVFYLRSSFILGLDALGSVIDSEQADSQFLAWQGYLEYLNSLSDKQTLSFRSNIQLANDSLVPIKQFAVGGFNSVRGYPQNTLLGDNGIFLSAELSHTLLDYRDRAIRLEIIPFIDFGKAWNSETDIEQERNLVAIGTGLKLSINDNLTARLDFGIPLVDLDDAEGDSLQENGIYFSINTRL